MGEGERGGKERRPPALKLLGGKFEKVQKRVLHLSDSAKEKSEKKKSKKSRGGGGGGGGGGGWGGGGGRGGGRGGDNSREMLGGEVVDGKRRAKE